MAHGVFCKVIEPGRWFVKSASKTSLILKSHWIRLRELFKGEMLSAKPVEGQ